METGNNPTSDMEPSVVIKHETVLALETSSDKEVKLESDDNNTCSNPLVETGIVNPNEDKDNPYAYIERNGFTSEKFKIEIRGLPRFYGIGELKKLLNTKLQLGSNKVKPPQKQSSWVFVTFRCEEDRDQALKVINGFKWKNKVLSASVAKPAPDPLVKRRNEARSEDYKRQKVEDNRTQEEKVKDSTVPLWRLSQEEQF